MDLELEGRGAVVLASSSGLGLAVATALLEEGASVMLSGRDAGRLAAATGPLRERHGERVHAGTLDVGDLDALRAHLASAEERLGGVDVLVTNTGGPPPAAAHEIDAAGLAAAAPATLGSAVDAIRAVLPGMRSRGFGRIVALTSIAVREPIAGLAYSNVLRAGLTSYLKSLSDEVAADGVLVNSVCMGLFGTARLEHLFEVRAEAAGTTPAEERARAEAAIPVRRVGDPAELGTLVAFLCSPRQSYVNGVALAVDGGLSRGLL